MQGDQIGRSYCNSGKQQGLNKHGMKADKVPERKRKRGKIDRFSDSGVDQR